MSTPQEELDSMEWNIDENLPVYTRDLLRIADRWTTGAEGEYTLGDLIRVMANDLGNRERDWSESKPAEFKNIYGRTPNEWSGHIVRSVREGQRFIPFEEWSGHSSEEDQERPVDEPNSRPYEEWLGGDSDEDAMSDLRIGEPRFYNAGESWESSIKRIVRSVLREEGFIPHEDGYYYPRGD